MKSPNGLGDLPLATLATRDGVGVVRIEARLPAPPDVVWSAFTDPARRAAWLGEITGDLTPGGRFTCRFFPSDYEGVGVVDACDAPRSLTIRTREEGQPELTDRLELVRDGDGTGLVLEESGMDASHLPAFGVGVQIHVENLTAFLDARSLVDPDVFWATLLPIYRTMSADLV